MTEGVREASGHYPAGTRAADAGRRWLFGSAVFDEATRELTVDGEIVEIEHKPKEVLAYLLRHAGEVVTKEELAEHVWPGRILTESVLSRCVSMLRAALKDERRELIRTVHGFGYRLVAQITVEAARRTHPPIFAFKSGDNPPLRPLWTLLEQLGSGANGEVWLAQHSQTRDLRVFKFAINATALSSLKREIALYRVLRDSLGEHAPVPQILDWNFDDAPYFIESEFVQGRDLERWADAQGGLAHMPLRDRVELAAKIADAVAAAHSVGVLHKDLKPGNVLIAVAAAGKEVRVKLCDFGSGGVLDPELLRTLGISSLSKTQMGLSGTPVYLAPELMSGQPATVKADVYALGVMLYQLVVGDLKRPIATGWEHEIEDDLLRDDITDAAAGNIERRLAEPTVLAERLRTLDARRVQRATERAERDRQERTTRAIRELRRARIYATALLGLATIAIGGALFAYRASERAVTAATSAKAVSDFLMDDVLRVDPSVDRPAEASYESLLNHAAAQVDERFKDQPEAAASVHWLLGRRYHEIGHIEGALAQYERAAPLMEKIYGRGAEPTMLVLDRIVHIYADLNRIPEALAISQELVRNWTNRHGATDPSTLLLRTRYARILIAAGDLAGGEKELRSVLSEIPFAHRPDGDTKIHFQDWLEQNLATDVSGLKTDASVIEALSARTNVDLGEFLAEYADEYQESVVLLRRGLEAYSKILDPLSDPVLTTRISLAWAEGMAGSYAESDKLFSESLDAINAQLPAAHPYRSIVVYALAYARLEGRRPDDAIAFARQAIDLCGRGCTARQRAEYLWILGCAYDQVGRSREAITSLSAALEDYEKARGSNHVGTIKKRVALADALRKTGKASDAASMLAAIRPEGLARLSPTHPIIAEMRRVQGLLALSEQSFDRAIPALEQAVAIFEQRLGSDHWRSRRARDELAAAKEAARRAELKNS